MKRRVKKDVYASRAFAAATAVIVAAGGLFWFAPLKKDVDPQTTAAIQEPGLRSGLPDDAMYITQTLPPDPRLETLKTAVDLIGNGEARAAFEMQQALAPDSLDRKLIAWLLCVSGNTSLSAGQIRALRDEIGDWPDQARIARHLERAMARNPVTTMRLRVELKDKIPETFQGAFAVARTYAVTGQSERIRALLAPFWHDQVLSASDEQRVIETFGADLTLDDHKQRFFNMMSRDRVRSGARIAPLIEADALHAAWAAVIRNNNNAGALLDALSNEDKASIFFIRAKSEYLRKSDRDDEAVALLAELPTEAEALINPDAWWDDRRIISRHKFENGDAETAYDLVANYNPDDVKIAVDAAFHAGWYALRGLENPELAKPHFEKITQIAKGSISLARGYYWLARATSDEAEADKYLRQAAAYSNSFYGQLAAAKLDIAPAMLGVPVNADDDNTELLRAISRLQEAGLSASARKLYVALGWSSEDAQEIRAATDHATEYRDYYSALKIAKAADWRGLDVGSLTHPVGAITNSDGLKPDQHALAYAVARQESEFNKAAVSKADARGLLQVLPGTAKEMARVTKLAYSPEKLTTDANYNARLGAAYLDQQLAKFEGSYILTFAAYNAGPRRAQEWIDRFGDPRGKDLEVVIDWIESIPFPETRNYVQRIMENLQVYKVQLGQDASIVSDLRFGARQ